VRTLGGRRQAKAPRKTEIEKKAAKVANADARPVSVRIHKQTGYLAKRAAGTG